MDYLNEEEVLKIEQFCGDKTMFEAVKKVLLAPIYKHGVLEPGKDHNPLINGAFTLVSQAPELTDEVLGQFLRAKWAGVSSLENGLEELKKIKSNKVGVEAPPLNEGV